MSGNIIETFPSLITAAKTIGVAPGNFRAALNKYPFQYGIYTHKGVNIQTPLEYREANYHGYHWKVLFGQVVVIEKDVLDKICT